MDDRLIFPPSKMKRALNSPDNTSTPKKSGRISELQDEQLDESFSPHPSIYVLASTTPLKDDDPLSDSIESTAEVLKKLTEEETHSANSQTPLFDENHSNNSEVRQESTGTDLLHSLLPQDTQNNPTPDSMRPEAEDILGNANDPNNIKTDMLSILIKYACDIKKELKTVLDCNQETQQEMRILKEEMAIMSEENKAIIVKLDIMTVENRSLKKQLIDKKTVEEKDDNAMEVNESSSEDSDVEIVPDVRNTRKFPTIQVNRQRPNPKTSNSKPQNNNISNKAKKHDARLKLKSKIEKEWGKTFHQRRVQYKRDFLNTEKAKILEDLKRNPLFLRRKYRPPPANSEQHHKILERKSIEMVKADIEELKMYAQEARQNYIKCDEQIEELVNYTYKDENDRFELMCLWEEEVLKSQPISRNMCQRNLSFLSNLYKTDQYKGYTPNQKRDFRWGQRQY